MTESTVSVSTLGKMADNMKAIGIMASSTEKEFTANQTEWSAEVAGKKVKESHGLMNLVPTHNNNDKVRKQQR